MLVVADGVTVLRRSPLTYRGHVTILLQRGAVQGGGEVEDEGRSVDHQNTVREQQRGPAREHIHAHLPGIVQNVLQGLRIESGDNNDDMHKLSGVKNHTGALG